MAEGGPQVPSRNIANHPSPGRPRNAELDTAILQATQDLLIERGFAGMTVEAVARAAGSGKAAVYRRWPSKTELVIAAVRALHDPPMAPDTGSLRDDLLECALHYTRGDARVALVMGSLLGGATQDAALRRAAREAIGDPRAGLFRTVIENWIARGVVSASAPVELLVGIVPSIAFGQVMLRRELIDRRTAVDLVDRVLLPALRDAP